MPKSRPSRETTRNCASAVLRMVQAGIECSGVCFSFSRAFVFTPRTHAVL